MQRKRNDHGHDGKLKDLNFTGSCGSLFSYSEYADKPSPYPSTPIKLSSTQSKKWIEKKSPDSVDLDVSDHDIFVEEEDSPEPHPAHEAHTGTKAMHEFFATYQNLNKNTTPSKFASASYNYLMGVDKMKQIPQPMGVVKWKGQPNELNLQYLFVNISRYSSYKMGDTYARALAEGMQHMNNEVVNLSDNRLTATGTMALISKIQPSTKYLDLSENVIGKDGAAQLGDCIRQNASKSVTYPDHVSYSLRGLNLENTKLGDYGTIQLCKYLVDHPRLSEINLAKNRITDVSAQAISEFVFDTYYLSNLVLHWNALTYIFCCSFSVRGEGAIRILDSMVHHSNLRVLDLSWNSIGLSKKKAFATKLAQTLIEQENLVHLDLSHNKIKKEDCAVIAEGLAQNHTLWGLHMIGNEGRVDAKGYLIPDKDREATAEHLAHRINGRRMVIVRKEEGTTEANQSADNCWICEGWNEAHFDWPPRIFLLSDVTVAVVTSAKPEPVYLHLECDDFQPDLMYADPETKGFQQWRMCPPGRCTFFFTIGGKPALSPKFPTVKEPFHRKARPLRSSPVDKAARRTFPGRGCVSPGAQCDSNKGEPERGQGVLRAQHPELCPPTGRRRLLPSQGQEDKEAVVVSGVGVQGLCCRHGRKLSDWEPIVADREVLRGGLEEHCEAEAQGGTDGKVSRCPQAELQDHVLDLRTMAPSRREVYKYYAAIGRTDSLFAVNKLTLTDFLVHKIFLMDGDKLSDMDITYTTIKGKPKAGRFHPKTALVRFEFTEIIWRIALKKYYESTRAPKANPH